MKSFLFITHLTPASVRSTLRKDLNEIYRKSLETQTYSNWKALVFSEEEKTEGQFKFVKLEKNDKENMFAQIKSILNRVDVKELIDGADYIVKLDDDDIISENILEKISAENFDCYCDQWHTFYDISSGIITQQKRQWIASTCIHKREHAFSLYKGPGASSVGILLYSDHSQAWHTYYQNKKVMFAKKKDPVYLRVVSPSSIAASATGGRVMKFEDVSMEKYKIYLSSFGSWTKAEVHGFDKFFVLLKNCWKNFSGKEQTPMEFPSTGIVKKLVNKFKGIIK